MGQAAEDPCRGARCDSGFKKGRRRGPLSLLGNISFTSIFSHILSHLTPFPPSPSPLLPSPPTPPFFHTLIVETYRKINFHYPAERPNVSPPCLIDDVQTPSHTPLLFIAPPSWSPFSAFLWQIITGDVIAIPRGE